MPVLLAADRRLHVDGVVEAVCVRRGHAPCVNLERLAQVLHGSCHARINCSNSRLAVADSHPEFHWIGVIRSLDTNGAAFFNEILFDPKLRSNEVASVSGWDEPDRGPWLSNRWWREHRQHQRRWILPPTVDGVDGRLR